MKKSNDFFVKNPFVLILLLLICGYITAHKGILPNGNYLLLIPAMLALMNVALIRTPLSKNIRIMILLLSLIPAAAGYYYSQNLIPQNNLVFADKKGSLEGYICKTSYRHDDVNYYEIKLNGLVSADSLKKISGRLLVTTAGIKERYQYGDEVKFTGKWNRPFMKRNPGEFDYRGYLQRQGIFHIAYTKNKTHLHKTGSDGGNPVYKYSVYYLKNYIDNIIDSYLKKENNGILKALITGEKRDIGRDIKEDFQKAGIIHVLAVSGLHVGFIGLFLFAILSFFRLPRRTRLYLFILCLFFYTAIVQFKPPVVRASLMASLYLMAKAHQRKASVYNIISAAATILLLINPGQLYDPGFQFSFLAVFSILYGYGKLDRLIPLRRKIDNIRPNLKIIKKFISFIWISLLVSIAATIGTFPLTIYYFGFLPVMGVIVNIVVIPYIGMIVFAGIFMLMFSIVSEFLTAGLAAVIEFLLDLLVNLTGRIADLSFSSIELIHPSVWIIIIMYFIIMLILNINYRSARFLLTGTILFLLIFYAVNSRQDYLDITFLDIGQGDATHIRFPNGSSMLVDGGPQKAGKRILNPYFKYKGIHNLDYLVISHPHKDHIGGIKDLLSKIQTDTLVISPYQYKSSFYESLLKLAKAKNITIRPVQKGDRLYPDPSCRVYVLHPDSLSAVAVNMSGHECNNSSVVLKVQYGQNGALLTGDIEKQSEYQLISYGDILENEMLKVAHHGSKTSTSGIFLAHVQPQVSIVSVAEKNRYKHPSEQVLSRLNHYNSRTYLTKNQGAVTFIMQKKKIFVQKQR